MFYFVTIALILHLSLVIGGIDVKFNGMIDLGPNWNYNHQIQPYAEDFDALSKSSSYADPEQLRGNRKKRKKIKNKPIAVPSVLNQLRDYLRIDPVPQNNSMSLIPEDIKNETIQFLINNGDHVPITEVNIRHPKRATRHVKNDTLKELYGRERKVKNDDLVRGFIEQVYKRNLKVIGSIKDKTSNRHMRSKINSLVDNYEHKFIEFSNATQKLKIKTKLGAQKVILDTIDTSNRILKRLANHLMSEINKKGALRNGILTTNVLQKEVEKETESELQYACKKFGICRSTDSFSRFIVDIITDLLHNKDNKLKQACDSLTELLKNSDSGGFMNPAMEKRYLKWIDYIERLPPNLLRSGLLIIKNTIANKNKPIVVNGKTDKRVNKTVAFLVLIDKMDANLPSNEANRLEWNDIKNSLHQWSEGRRWDIEDIMQTLLVLLRKGIQSMENSSAESNWQILLN